MNTSTVKTSTADNQPQLDLSLELDMELPLRGPEEAWSQRKQECERVYAFARSWNKEDMGTASKFVSDIEKEYGSLILVVLVEIVRTLADPEEGCLQAPSDFTALFDPGDWMKALRIKPRAHTAEMAALDDFFYTCGKAQRSQRFVEAIRFVSRFRPYSPYNNMLVYLQRPQATFWARASDWEREFGRKVKEDARPMLILAPMTPVLLVYDVEDTDGPALPEMFTNPFDVQGVFSHAILDRTIENCSRDHVAIRLKSMSAYQAGWAEGQGPTSDVKMLVQVNDQLNPPSRYATLCHELAHIHLGHLGNDKDEWWPSRTDLPLVQVEIEAEAVSYLVCYRAGLTTRSADYLALYFSDHDDFRRVSLDLIVKVAGYIESMGHARLAPRKHKGNRSGR